MTEAFDSSSGLEGLASWLNSHDGVSGAVRWEGPTDNWRVRRLEIVPPGGQCRVSLWNEDGDIRAVFDGRFDLTFDDRDQQEWNHLLELMEAVLQGRVVMSRRPPFLRWRVVITDPSQKTARGRRFSAYI